MFSSSSRSNRFCSGKKRIASRAAAGSDLSFFLSLSPLSSFFFSSSFFAFLGGIAGTKRLAADDDTAVEKR
jgi:hypothetical protein